MITTCYIIGHEGQLNLESTKTNYAPTRHLHVSSCTEWPDAEQPFLLPLHKFVQANKF